MPSTGSINVPEPNIRTGMGYSGNRRVLASLGVVILLLGFTNYKALTDDAFRVGALRHLSPGFKAANPAIDENDRIRSVEAAREAALTTEIDALRGSLALMKADALVLRKSNIDLAARERATNARLAIAEKHRLAGVAAAERLGNRMKTRVGKSVARQLATLPGKVLPAVGATVVVASTALELHDLCAGMRDIAALNQAVGLPALDDRDVCGVRIGSVQSIVENATQNFTATYANAMQAAGLKASPPPHVTGVMPGRPVPTAPTAPTASTASTVPHGAAHVTAAERDRK